LLRWQGLLRAKDSRVTDACHKERTMKPEEAKDLILKLMKELDLAYRGITTLPAGHPAAELYTEAFRFLKA
jgi:hypothetical protein